MTNVPPKLQVRVAEARAEAKDVLALELRACDGRPLPPFEPGAHVEVTLPNGLVRHYSLTNDWRETDRYTIGVGRADESRGGSDWIHANVRRDTILPISTPRNNFPLDPEASSFRFIAGGIGITPIMAMIRWCEANGRQWRLVYACRSHQRAAFYEDLRRFGPEKVGFHFDDEAGTVLDVADALQSLAEGEKVYCCGPDPLMQAVQARSAALPPGTVRFEWFTVPPQPPAGEAERADIGAFEVHLKRAGLTLAVAPDKSILETIEAAGLDVPFSCREGLCGTCQTTVIEGDPEHRDYVLSDEERAAGKSMCVCVSRSKSPRLVLDL